VPKGHLARSSLYYDGFLFGIFHFFIYFQIEALLIPTLRATSALFQSHSLRRVYRASLVSFLPGHDDFFDPYFGHPLSKFCEMPVLNFSNFTHIPP